MKPRPTTASDCLDLNRVNGSGCVKAFTAEPEDAEQDGLGRR